MKDKEKRGHSAERRRKVDHWVPAIWIPDWKTSSCMRCGLTVVVASMETLSFMWTMYLCSLALDGLVPLIIHFRVDLISVSSPLVIFYCRNFFISDSNAKQRFIIIIVN